MATLRAKMESTQESREQKKRKRYLSYASIYVICIAFEYIQRLFGVDYQRRKGFVKTDEGPLGYIDAFLDLGWEVILYAAILFPILAWVEGTKYSKDSEHHKSGS